MPPPRRNANCHIDRPHCALGFCKTCYANYKNSLNREKLRLRAVESRKNNKEKRKEAYVKKKFGISLEEYNKIKESQNHKCFICGLKASHLDHNHETGIIRKFLCYKCNVGLGYFNEDVKLFSKAIRYLESYR